ncbi:pre-rRNA-processing protein esf1 isoform X2 [Prosopis cineraria]|uniref:pre-rRNA-processing protein esf1 isoform X2 n=1 Tax=Prosopis cineraria TaxID=364024 RepID=UPI00241099E7|nr:pre-rRNA-processing protein esf1 isoform X2 [Prosopis cineraria]
MGSEKRFLERMKKNKKHKKNNHDTLNSSASSVVPEKDGGGKETIRVGKVIADPRFSSLHTDPRFREPPKRKTKVAIDSRFDRIFTDKSFLPSSAPVDKRGKLRKQNLRQSSLRHYYKMDEEGNQEEDVEEGSDEEDKEEEKGQRLVEPGRGTPAEESSESEDENNACELGSSTDTDGDESADEELPERQEEVPEIDKETHRLAVVNMDWRYVKAVDLYVLLSSFVPPNGQIKSVAVYPSEFGLQRMKDEEVHGPVGLFDDEATQSDQDSSDDEIDNEKLRAYEKSRMRYYFAVVECDSVTTADHIYKECDGLEFLQSSNALDLRFIPDSMEIKNSPLDVATEAPANYEGKDFYTRALQHSKVHLSWDEDEPLRAKTLRRKFNDEQLAELELTELLASDVGESDDEDDIETEDHAEKKTRKLEKYRALLEFGEGSDGDGEEDGQDMEVTFNTGLEDISKHILEKRDKKSETVWEAYLRKRREKKRDWKSKSKHSSSDDDNSDTDQDTTEQADDFFMEEPPIKKRKEGKSKQKHQVIDGAEKTTKEELELLLADDQGANTGLRGYNLKFKMAKGKRAQETIEEAKIPSADLDDPRFAALFTSRDYVLDPTEPQFKRSAVYARQRAHKLQKGDIDFSAEEKHVKLSRGIQLSSNDAGVKKGDEEGSDVLQSKEKHELSSLVKSVKMKSKQVQLPSLVQSAKGDGNLQFGGVKKRNH